MLHLLYVVWYDVPESRFSGDYLGTLHDSCILLDDALDGWLRYSELGLNPYIEVFSQEAAK